MQKIDMGDFIVYSHLKLKKKSKKCLQSLLSVSIPKNVGEKSEK